MTDEAKRLFSREYKLAALQRMLAGENVSALARELGVRRKYLYQWRERFRAGGPLALRSRAPPDALTTAQRRIAELERKVGQQQVELDFFQRALRQVREVRQRSGAPGGTASTRSSKR